MASKQSSSNSNFKFFIFSLIFLSLFLFLLVSTPPRNLNIPGGDSLKGRSSIHLAFKNSTWHDVIVKEMKGKKMTMKVGLVNMGDPQARQESDGLQGLAETVNVDFERVNKRLEWKDFFPEWIDEESKWSPPKCPEVPMPRPEDYRQLDVAVARLPCGRGPRDVYGLQVNLVVANLLVSAWKDDGGHDLDQAVYAVFVGSCGPMLEIFRCDDLLWHEGDYWVYRPELRRLKQKVLMPVGSCQLAPPYALPGQEEWRRYSHPSSTDVSLPREAYVTILHSSEAYVCGAIALARSIIQTNTTRELLLLADDSISQASATGLEAAGWKVKRIEQRIRGPQAKKNAYNEWNYSKLWVWRLTEYDKIIFLDTDIIVLRNMDPFFVYPQLSASGNDKYLFNSGVMLVEPSICMFKALMEKRFSLNSYNGGDQGFLNEVFTWWHRWPKKVNQLKMFKGNKKDPERQLGIFM